MEEDKLKEKTEAIYVKIIYFIFSDRYEPYNHYYKDLHDWQPANTRAVQVKYSQYSGVRWKGFNCKAVFSIAYF